MKKFLNENFLLENATAERLYHEYAKDVPIIDYHSHLPPDEIAEDKKFENISSIWLAGDHYKWRAMRANGVNETYCTGDAADRDKFMKWAETVPMTLRNPLYHWTHMELKRYFGIDALLGPDTAEEVYEQTREMLQQDEFSVRNLLRRMNVEVVCTTDDPVDTLEHHRAITNDPFETKVLPTWRADKAMAIDHPETYTTYLDRLEEAANQEIGSFMDLLEALKKRHDHFDNHGCKLSDHGLETFYFVDFTHDEIEKIFLKLRKKETVSQEEKRKFQTAMLIELAAMDYEKNWVQQFHVGAIRNNNSRQFASLGPDKGYDSIGDFPVAQAMSRFLDRMDRMEQLAKTIVYNLNPRDNELIVTMLYNFNDGSVPGKMQFGSGWWFMDQKKGMEDQMNALSQLGLISRFVGMLTDSRSFLSFPRHEYFRRILCNLFGKDMESGELPDDMDLVGAIVRGVCYTNAREYFRF
jgi:glucuronate isomerase